MAQSIVLGISIWLQLAFGGFLLLGGVFSAAAALNAKKYTPWQMSFLNKSIFLLPISSLLAVVLVLMLFLAGYGYFSLYFHIIPIIYCIIFWRVINSGIDVYEEHH